MADPTICRADGCVNAAELDDPPFCKVHLQALTGDRATIRIRLPHCAARGCKQKPKSPFLPYCQMHDARVRRHGLLTQKPRAQVLRHSHGYRLVLAHGHPMARGMRAYEHRMVYFDAHPDGPEPCHWCGAKLEWTTIQVDHLNAVRDDNRIENLVASCGRCNRDRAKPAAARAARERARGYMVNGKWLSIADAARKLRVAPSSIVDRLAKGWDVERAMTEPRGKFGPKRAA